MNPNKWHDIIFKNHDEVSIMEKFIPYEKLSKKQKRKMDLGRTESRHKEAGKQKGIQEKQSPELEACISRTNSGYFMPIFT